MQPVWTMISAQVFSLLLCISRTARSRSLVAHYVYDVCDEYGRIRLSILEQLHTDLKGVCT
jgi:hypothetical protein